MIITTTNSCYDPRSPSYCNFNDNNLQNRNTRMAFKLEKIYMIFLVMKINASVFPQ